MMAYFRGSLLSEGLITGGYFALQNGLGLTIKTYQFTDHEVVFRPLLFFHWYVSEIQGARCLMGQQSRKSTCTASSKDQSNAWGRGRSELIFLENTNFIQTLAPLYNMDTSTIPGTRLCQVSFVLALNTRIVLHNSLIIIMYHLV